VNATSIELADDLPLHTTVYRLLRENIASGHLAPGTPLIESRIAQELGLSRQPVSRALAQLEREGIIVRDGPRGYVCGGAPRVHGRDMPILQISEMTLAIVRGRAEWEKIWDRVQGNLVACMPFGRYKVIETTMADHYGVSRAVTRDLLARFETIGLIEREGRSQCFLRQLTAQFMSDLYEIRRLLEPAALCSAAPYLERGELIRMREELLDAERRYPDVSPADINRLENDLHIMLTDRCPNRSLIKLLRQSQTLVLATNRLIPLYLGMPPSEPFFAEHRLVVELLLNGATESAVLSLAAHLVAAARKQQFRLLELRAHSPAVPPYLSKVADE